MKLEKRKNNSNNKLYVQANGRLRHNDRTDGQHLVVVLDSGGSRGHGFKRWWYCLKYNCSLMEIIGRGSLISCCTSC